MQPPIRPFSHEMFSWLWKIKVLVWLWWFVEEPLTFTQPFYCTKGYLVEKVQFKKKKFFILSVWEYKSAYNHLFKMNNNNWSNMTTATKQPNPNRLIIILIIIIIIIIIIVVFVMNHYKSLQIKKFLCKIPIVLRPRYSAAPPGVSLTHTHTHTHCQGTDLELPWQPLCSTWSFT